MPVHSIIPLSRAWASLLEEHGLVSPALIADHVKEAAPAIYIEPGVVQVGEARRAIDEPTQVLRSEMEAVRLGEHGEVC